MKKIKVLLGFIVTIALGWILSYLRIPYLDSSDSFFQGFIICLVLVLVVAILNRIILQKPNNTLLKKNRFHFKVRLFFMLLILLLSVFAYKQTIDKNFLASENQTYLNELEIQQTITEKAQHSSQTFLLSTVLKRLREEKIETLTDSIIDELAALSKSLKPYRYSVDSSKAKKMSPERGQLLLSLIAMKFDSLSFSKMLSRVTFAKADLRNVNLEGKNLEGINLEGADLSNSELGRIVLKNAKLKGANLWGARIENANLSNSDLSSSIMEWSNLNYSNLSFAEISGAKMSNIKMKNTNLKNSTMKFVNLNGGKLLNSNLNRGDLYLSSLIQTDLSGSQMDYCRLSKTILKDAKMNDVQLNRLVVRKGWLNKLIDWNVDGQKEIHTTYKIVEGKSEVSQVETHYLVFKN